MSSVTPTTGIIKAPVVAEQPKSGVRQKFSAVLSNIRKTFKSSQKKMDQRTLVKAGQTTTEIRKSIPEIQNSADLTQFVHDIGKNLALKTARPKKHSLPKILSMVAAVVCTVATVAAIAALAATGFGLTPIVIAVVVGAVMTCANFGGLTYFHSKDKAQQALYKDNQYTNNIQSIAANLIDTSFGTALKTQLDEKSQNKLTPAICQDLATKALDLLDDANLNKELKQLFINIETRHDKYLSGANEDDPNFAKDYQEFISGVPTQIIDSILKVFKNHLQKSDYQKMTKLIDSNKNNIVVNSATFIKQVFKNSIDNALYTGEADKKSDFKRKQEKLKTSVEDGLTKGLNKYKTGKDASKAAKKLG